MKRDLRIILLSFVAVLMTVTGIFGQETTGSIEVTVKDEANAVVPNATVTIENAGSTTSFKRTVTANDSGFVRVIMVPPGEYSVIVAAISGFAERRADNVSVGLGKTTPVNIVLGTSLDETVTVTANDTGLDIRDDKGNTTLTSKLVELIPKGINFSSVLKYSAATRPEPRSGQFQIDGASGAENTFVIDGLEVTDVLSGYLDRNTNLPLSILQETQVKTTGFEAEFGGATGGVINMVTKGGNNQWHGEAGSQFRSWKFEPTPGMTLIGLDTITGNPQLNLPTPAYYLARRSPDKEFNPTGTLMGPIWKNHAWFSIAYAPQIWERERTLTYSNLRSETDPNVILPPLTQTHTFKRRSEKVFARVDGQLFNKLNLYGTYKWSPEHNQGLIPGYGGELAKSQTCLGALCGADYFNQTGGRINSVNATVGGSWLVTSKFILSARVGYYFMNNMLGTYGIGDVDSARVVCSEWRNTTVAPSAQWPLTATQFPSGFGCGVGQNNHVPAANFKKYDRNIRDQIDGDATYSFDIGGRHELKGGYQENRTRSSEDSTVNDRFELFWGKRWYINAFAYLNMVRAIVNKDLPYEMSPTAVGVGRLTIFSSKSNARGINKAYYAQDKWQVHKRLTLNLGVRLEQENVPALTEDTPSIKFGLGAKVAPRIGASYDLKGDGKTRISAFYGLFYDRFKLGLVRRTFAGSEVFHELTFELFPGDTLATINRQLVTGGSPLSDGTNCPTGTTTPIYGRVRCDRDNGFFGTSDPIDPNIKAFRQREVTFSVQHQLNRNYMFSARYSRKQVIDAIEDSSTLDAAGGEIFVIGNPGQGLIKERFDELGLIAPKAQRQYDALELKIDRRFANNWFFSANYTYSRLYGNYGGLISSDEEGTRDDPYIQRYFDTPGAGFTLTGRPDNGLLATDRPNVLKAFGAYSLTWDKLGLWKNNSTDFQFFYTASSGSLITSFVSVNKNEQIIMDKRGDQGRTPWFSQTDFALRHNIKFGKDGRFNLKFDADVINLFNQGILVNKGVNTLSGQAGNLIAKANFVPTGAQYGLVSPTCTATPGYASCWAEAYRNFQANGSPVMLAEAKSAALRNPYYNVPYQWQGKRNVRYGVHFTF
ncbi:MAG: TonB-dependent receptor [Pyrinomonadaceae bacterium]|nr:TonB-dependent receptor [Pyrinomonadaceae bacterium]